MKIIKMEVTAKFGSKVEKEKAEQRITLIQAKFQVNEATKENFASRKLEEAKGEKENLWRNNKKCILQYKHYDTQCEWSSKIKTNNLLTFFTACMHWYVPADTGRDDGPIFPVPCDSKSLPDHVSSLITFHVWTSYSITTPVHETTIKPGTKAITPSFTCTNAGHI